MEFRDFINHMAKVIQYLGYLNFPAVIIGVIVTDRYTGHFDQVFSSKIDIVNVSLSYGIMRLLFENHFAHQQKIILQITNWQS